MLALAKTADHIVAVSEVEAQYRAAGCNDVIVLGHALSCNLPLRTLARVAASCLWRHRKTVSPTVTARLVVLDHVWPTIQAQLGDAARLDIVGVCDHQGTRTAFISVRLWTCVDDLGLLRSPPGLHRCPRGMQQALPHKAHEAASREAVISDLDRQPIELDGGCCGGADAGFAQTCVRCTNRKPTGPAFARVLLWQ